MTTPAGPCFLCGAPYANHLNGQCPAPPLARQHDGWDTSGDILRIVMIVFISFLAVIVALYGIVHVANAQVTKNNPPAACQLLGGSWNFWDGWTCN